MDHRIVFRDKKGVLKGPYPERTIQEWYRSGWFDRSFEFSFLPESEQFSDQTPVYSLGQLIDSNGPGCPFLGPPLKNRLCQQDEKLNRLEKEIVEFRSAIGSVPALKRRLEAIEKRIEALTKHQPPSESVATVTETGPSQRVREECEKLASRMVFCVNYVLDRLQSGNFGNDQKGGQLLKYVRDFLASSDDAAKCLASDVVLQKLQQSLERREFVYCSQCHTVAFNPRQALMHLISSSHAHIASSACNKWSEPVLDALDAIVPVLQTWCAEDYELLRSQHVTAHPGDVVPTMDFWMQQQFKHGVPTSVKVFGEHGLESTTPLHLVPAVKDIIKGDLGTALISQLNDHMGNGKTGCYNCGVVTGTREAFYKHVLSSSHLEQITKLRCFDVITIAVNCHLKHLGKTSLI